jgi:hypothetical protein
MQTQGLGHRSSNFGEVEVGAKVKEKKRLLL